MAIPFALPSEEEPEDQTQQLEQLMLDLYAALQQVLRARNAQHPSRNREYSTLLRRPGDSAAGDCGDRRRLRGQGGRAPMRWKRWVSRIGGILFLVVRGD